MFSQNHVASSSAQFHFACARQRGVVRVCGRANCTVSPFFKGLIARLAAEGTRELTIDLETCSTMDSTFLGMLAGLSMEFSGGHPPPGTPVIDLYRPNARVLDLLENLGIAHLFRMVDRLPENLGDLREAGAEAANGSKRALCETSLAAHETLVQLNPDNAPKFKDVMQFLADDLNRSDPPPGR